MNPRMLTIDLHGIELDVEFYPSDPGEEGVEIVGVYEPGKRRNLCDMFSDEAFRDIADIIIKEQ